jgi:hypothetical protein
MVGNGCPVYGCTDPAAVNYDAAATADDGSCDYLGCTNPTATNYDSTATIDDGSCVYGCQDNTVNVTAGGGSWDSEISWDIVDGSGAVVASGVAGAATTYCLVDDCYTVNMYDAYGDGWNGGIITLDDGAGNVLATDGLTTGSFGSFNVALGSAVCAVYGCTDPVACNYDASANTDDGTCTYATAPYDCNGNCVNDADGDGICDEDEVAGCTDSLAFNYDPLATDDDGSCQAIIVGCTDPTADNYLSTANTDDGTCVWFGCTDPAADNYDASATVDDNSCTYSTVSGCTDPAADNYDANATTDDGSCTYTCDAPPTGLNAWDITDTRFRLGWDNMNTSSCMVLKYHVRFREAATATSAAGSWTTRSAGAGNGLCAFGLNNVEKLMINFNPSTTYDIRMRAMYCSDPDPTTGWSAWTSSMQVTMADPCPDLVNVAVQTFNGQQNKAKFTWDTTGVYSFARLYTRVNGGTAPYNWTIQGGFGIDYPTFFKNIFTFTPGETYRVQANSFCSYTMTSYKGNLTPPVIWTQPGGSSREIGGETITNLDVYPNPSRDVFNVAFMSDEVQDLEVRMINVVGEVIYTENLEQFVGAYTKQIDLAAYTKGVYFLEITTNNGVVNKKLILQ